MVNYRSLTLNVLLGAIILILLALLLNKCGNNKPTYIPNNPQTVVPRDTITKKVYVYDTITRYITIVPPSVTKYVTIPQIDSNAWVKDYVGTDTDNIHFFTWDKGIDIPSPKRDSLQVSATFLYGFPNNPKIIKNTISRDSITYDLFYPSGEIFTKSYPINTQNYSYVWENDHLKALDALPIKVKPKLHGESYVYTTYNPFQHSAILSVDYAITYKKLALYTKAYVSVNQLPSNGVEAGLRLKLR